MKASDVIARLQEVDPDTEVLVCNETAAEVFEEAILEGGHFTIETIDFAEGDVLINVGEPA